MVSGAGGVGGEESVRVGFVNGYIPGDLQRYMYKCTVREKKKYIQILLRQQPHPRGPGGLHENM